MTAHHWSDPTSAANTNPGKIGFLPEARYKFGAISTTLRTNDAEFKARFNRIFGDCGESPQPKGCIAPVSLEVVDALAADRVFACIRPGNGAFDATALAIVSPELQPMPQMQALGNDWHYFSRTTTPERPMMAVRMNQWVFDRRAPWQSTMAHYFLHHVMQLQRKMLFFHAATVAIDGQGVLLSGAKGAGKSTLSLALAARGHDFLGDEIATVDGSSGCLQPFPRAVSIRHGPQARAVTDYLAEHPVDKETLVDGTQRMRMPVSQLFPASRPRAVPMRHAFFMQGRARRPRATQFAFSLGHLPLLAPLHATISNLPVGERTIKFLRLFSQVRCHLLIPGGTPDETAQLINNIVESGWD